MNNRFLLPSILAASALSAGAATVQFDFNHSNDVSSGSWTNAPSGNGSNGTVTVSTTAFGGDVSVDTRDRTNNGTPEPDMWRDFVFGLNSNTAGEGLSVAVTGLAPNTTFPITIWAYDTSSQPARTANWSGGGGSGLLTFNGSDPLPTSLAQNRVDFNATTDGTGALTLVGEHVSGNTHTVFINGLEIGDAIPEPSSAILSLFGAALILRRRRG